MALSKKSLVIVEQIKQYILSKRIKEFPTRGCVDAIIEDFKFPYIRKSWQSAKCDPNKWRKTFYANKQYNPIREHLIEEGFLKFKGYNGRKKVYEVINKCEPKPTPTPKPIVEKKPTRKDKLFNFILSKGNKVRRKEMIRFLVDDKYGIGTYDVNPNMWRGYYACAFSSYPGKNDYLYKGKRYLYQNFDHSYSVGGQVFM